MKRICFVVLLMILSSCDKEDICGEAKIYQFSEEELKLIAIDDDSAIFFQKSINDSKKTHIYNENHFAVFIDSFGNEIEFELFNLLVSKRVCNNYNITGSSNIVSIDSSFITQIRIEIQKNSSFEEVEKMIYFTLDDRSYSFHFNINDTSVIDYGWKNGTIDNSQKNYLVSTEENIELSGKSYPCYKFYIFNELKDKELEVYFNNDLSLLKIVRDNEDAITRISGDREVDSKRLIVTE